MADKQISQLVAASTVNDDDLLVLQQGGIAKKLTGKKLGDYVYAAATEKIAEVEEIIAEAQEAVDDLEDQKNTIAEAVASMAELGTDDTLSTPGMAADAAAAGVVKNEVAALSGKIGTKPGLNLYDEVHNSEVQQNPQYVIGTVFLDGYSGDLMVSAKGNNTSYITDPVIYYSDTSEAGTFGTATYSSGNLRRGKPITIPNNATKLTFKYRIASSTSTLVEEVMVTKGTEVPAYYEAYKTITILVNSEYVDEEEVNEIIHKVAYVTLNGSDSNGGTSSLDGFATIAKALSVADEVLVQRGTYNEIINVSDHDNIVIIPYDNNATYDVEEPYRDKITVSGATFTRCNNLRIEDMCSKNSSAQGFYFDQCMNVTLFNCESYNSVSNGFQADNTNIIFDRCSAINSGNDGFNFHSYGQSVMRDCNAINSYDDGCSHHNGCHGTIIGGNFVGNTGKGGITPAYGSDVSIYGAYCAGNRVGLDYLSYAGNHPMTANVVCCALVNNIETGIVASALCTVNAINCVFSGNAADTGGAGTINRLDVNGGTQPVITPSFSNGTLTLSGFTASPSWSHS